MKKTYYITFIAFLLGSVNILIASMAAQDISEEVKPSVNYVPVKKANIDKNKLNSEQAISDETERKLAARLARKTVRRLTPTKSHQRLTGDRAM
jgi:hypothetical protein